LDYSKRCYSMAGFAELLRRARFSPEHMIELGDLGLPLVRGNPQISL
jgi:hypothetical protein